MTAPSRCRARGYAARMPRFALAAVGRDRPGIVAGVTGALLDHGVNIEDSQMAILRGHFAMMLILAAPDGVSRESLSDDLEAVAARLGLESISLAVVDDAPVSDPGPTHVVSVYGVDHPGIVHAVASALAERDITITDMSTRVVGETVGEPLYAMMLEVALPPGMAEFEPPLDAVAAAQGVDLTVRRLEPDDL